VVSSTPLYPVNISFIHMFIGKSNIFPLDSHWSVLFHSIKSHEVPLSPWNPYISSCSSLFIQSTSKYPSQVTRLPLGFEAWSPWTGRWWRWAARARSGTPISGRRCGCYGACDWCGCCGWSNWGVRREREREGYPWIPSGNLLHKRSHGPFIVDLPIKI